MKFFVSALTAITLFMFTNVLAFAHDYNLGNLTIEHPHIPATVKAAPVAAGYLIIKNNGTEDDRLVSVSAGFSAKQQIHTMTMIEGVMRMRPLKDGIVIPAGGEVSLQKGGNHLMFMKLSEQMQAGELRDVTLTFEKAGELKIGMIVIAPEDLDDEEESSEDHSGH